MRIRWTLLVIIAVLGIGGCNQSCARNVILNSVSPGEESGVIVIDGFGTIFESSYRSTNTTIAVGNRSGQGQVATYSRYRPVAVISPVDWNAGDVTVNFVNQITMPITVWIVRGTFATQRTLALNAISTTLNMFWNERTGLTLGISAINDATANANASKYANFTCTQQSAMQTDIGQTAGQINIYFVNQVDRGGGNYGTGNGNACAIGGNFVALGSAIGTDLLAHEIGHNLGLTHVDDLTTDFDQTNVMFSSSNTRGFFTEGQTFRAHLTGASAINATYNARAGQVTRNCGRDQSDKQCPPTRKRIWADGTFAAN